MADEPKTPAPGQPALQGTAPAQQASAQQAPAGNQDEAEKPDWMSRAGTILMAAALAGLAVVLLDVALKGRLLGPLVARLPMPKASTVEEDSDGTPRAAGD